MKSIDRRSAIKGALALGAGMNISGFVYAQDKPAKEELTQDQKNVMEAGLTQKEAECWSLTAKAAGAFFALPELHPMDKQEVAQAIHILQNKLLGRPTYRKYLEISKKKAGKKE